MEEFTLKNFDKFYAEKLEPQLIKLEKERKKIRRRLFFPIILFVIFLNSFFITPCFFGFGLDDVGYEAYLLPLMLIFCGFCMFISVLKGFQIINIEKQYIKNNLYKTLFAAIGFKYEDDYIKIGQYRENIDKIYQKKDITYASRVIDITIDDAITGNYNSSKFSAVDALVYYQDQRKNSWDFRGIVLQTKTNKPFNCEIIIKPERFIQLKNRGELDKVKLESLEFEKKFEVYSNDQVEARYILTTAFLERLLKYKRYRHGKPLEVYISNNITDEANIFFFITTDKDNFEIPFFQPLTDKMIYYEIFSELLMALDVINELKINQNIGL